MILLSLFAWFFILYYSITHPNIVKRIGERGGGGGGSTTTVHNFYYYRIKLAHASIDASQSIILYNAYSEEIYTIPPYSSQVDYSSGIIAVPGTEKNTIVESISTATYYVFYSSDDLIIDYDRVKFKISKSLIRSTAETAVKATFEYLSVITPFKDIASVIDGRWDTQVQTEFFSEPPIGYNYAILDLGTTKSLQALDIVAGFYKPDSVRKFDIQFNATIQYSLNGTDYYDVSDKTNNFQLSGGESKSFEEEDLGVGFKARYLKLVLENVDKIEYSSEQVEVADDNKQYFIKQGLITTTTPNGTKIVTRSGIYVVAITEISAYDNIIIKSESELIPYTTLATAISITSGTASGTYSTTVTVASTEGFASSGVAYIIDADNTYDAFTYTAITTTKFTGVTGLQESHSIGVDVVQEIASGSNRYDYNTVRPKLGDRIFKLNKIDDNLLFTQSQLDNLAAAYMEEFLKNHTKSQIDIAYSPHLEIGQTLRIVSAHANIDRNYFIESISNNSGFLTITAAYYPNI